MNGAGQNDLAASAADLTPGEHGVSRGRVGRHVVVVRLARARDGGDRLVEVPDAFTVFVEHEQFGSPADDAEVVACIDPLAD